MLIIKIRADKLFDAGDYASAYSVYKELPEEYQTHAADYQEAYNSALELQKARRYDDAISAFESLRYYPGASEMVVETKHLKAESLVQAGKYDDAAEIFILLGDQDNANRILYEKANGLRNTGDYIGAASQYTDILD